MRRGRIVAVLAAVVLPVSLALAGAAIGGSPSPQAKAKQVTPAHQLEAAINASAKYVSTATVQKNGYALFSDIHKKQCIAEPGMGGMGVHFVNSTLVGDPSINSGRPESVVYRREPNGKLVLSALEYIVVRSAWLKTHKTRPYLYGQKFNLTGAGNRYGLPPFYSLHIWLWDTNPAGMFSMWNPQVHCTKIKK